MKSDWYLPFIGLVLVVLVAPIIPRPVPLAADEPAVITVGVLSPWTGALAPAGQRLKNAVELAVSEINAGGGLMGRKLSVRLADYRSNPDLAAGAVQSLVTEGADVIIGGMSGETVAGIVDIVDANEIPMITPLPLDPPVVESGWIFSVSFPAELQARAQARYMIDTLGCTRPFQIVDVSQEDLTAGAKLTAALMVEAGVPFVAVGAYRGGDDELMPLLSGARERESDCVAMAGSAASAVRLRLDMDALGLLNVPLIADFGVEDTVFVDASGKLDPASAGLLTAVQFSHEDARPAAQEFCERYRNAYGTVPSPEAALAYDAVMLYRTAVQRAGTFDRHLVRDALASLDSVVSLATTPSFAMGADGTALKSVTILESGEDGSWHFKDMVHPVPLAEATPHVTAELRGRLTFAGSTSVQPLAAKLSDAFRSRHPDLGLDIAAGGSVVGIQAIHDGTVDIGMASRELSAEEARDIDVYKIAVDVIAVVVNETNPVSNLTLDQLRKIYTGRITRWTEVGGPDEPISVVARERTSGTRGAFDAIVLGEGVEPESPGLRTAMTAGDAAAFVLADPTSIGYVGFGNIEPNLHLLAIDGIVPNVEAVREGIYPLVRPLQLMTGALSQPVALNFIEFVLGPEGQMIVADNGWVPVR